ncbi:hypothetical protein LPUS_10956 [Lasallia pustulata]|uniref:Uncharacterized protein n=1 Tax=Lasallia pustulata TaxID=136370 RepID=A0A1W5DB50_9LECA|nr:hypothetical protein LPUS_10956 [Lasallia pustulata]
MDTPSALTDDFASEVEYDFASPDQPLHNFFPELGPTEYLGPNGFVEVYSSPESGFIDPTFTTKMNPLDDIAYNDGAPRTLHGGTHNESSGPAQGASVPGSSISSDGQADIEQQHSDDGVVEGPAVTMQSSEGHATSSENALHDHDLSSLQRGATEQSLNRYTPMVHSNPETPRLPSNSSFGISSPLLSRTYSQHATQQLATGSGNLGRQPRRTMSYSSEYTDPVGISSLHDIQGQSYTQLPMPNAVARLQGGGTQNLYRTSGGLLSSSPAAITADPSSVDRRPTPDYSHNYGQNITTSRYSDFQQIDPLGYQTRPFFPSLDPISPSHRLSYGAQTKGEYGSPNQRSSQQQAYNSSRGQLYQTSPLSTNDDHASSSLYLGHTARTYNPRQAVLQGVDVAEQETLKFEDDDNPMHSVKLTQFANLEEARHANVPDGAPGPVPYDPTIPESDIEKQRVVLKLMDALNDMSDAQDNEGMKSTWRSFLNNQGQLEHVAWQILERCILRHKQKGSLTTNSKPNHHYENFDKRMTDILQGLRTQKTMCKHLMVAPYIDSLIDNPGYAASRIVNNRKVNLGKKMVTDKARAVLGQKTQGKGRRMLSVQEDETNDEDGDYDEDDDAPFDTDTNRRTPIGRGVKTTQSLTRTSRKRKATSEEDVLNPPYPPPAKRGKKAPRPTQSTYNTEGNFLTELSAGPSQQHYGMGASGTSQQGLGQGQRDSGGFMGRQDDEDLYGVSNSGEADPSQGQLSAEGEEILQQLLDAQQTDDLLNPGDLLDEGTYVQGGKIVRHDPDTGASEVLYDDFLLSPQYSQFSPFIRQAIQRPYAPTMDPQIAAAAFGTRSTARTRRAAGRTTEQNIQPARQPPYGYTAVAPADEAVNTLQRAPAGRKRSRR